MKSHSLFVFAIALWRNDDGDSRVAQPFDQCACIVTFVAQQRAASDAFEQLPHSANIVDVTPVTISLTGLPKASASAWILLVKPPRERPDGLVLAPFFRAPALC